MQIVMPDTAERNIIRIRLVRLGTEMSTGQVFLFCPIQSCRVGQDPVAITHILLIRHVY